MASEAPQPRAGSELKKKKRAGSRELKFMAFAASCQTMMAKKEEGKGEGHQE
jgi:hypothetical protein